MTAVMAGVTFANLASFAVSWQFDPPRRITTRTINQPDKVAKKLVPVIMNKSTPINKDVASEPTNQPLSQETVQALQELGSVFRQIHRRLISEGYTIQNGKLTKPGASDEINNGTKG